jgi:hypothetical protein
MDWLQWAITTIVGILGIIAGRAWERYDRIAQKDKEIYTKILELLPHDNLLFFKQHDFAGPFRRSQIKPIREFEEYCKRADFIFIDSKLEKMRNELLKNISDFTLLYAQEAFAFDSPVPDLVRVRYPEDMRHEFEGYERKSIVLRLNQLADEVSKSYETLVKTARKKL